MESLAGLLKSNFHEDAGVFYVPLQNQLANQNSTRR